MWSKFILQLTHEGEFNSETRLELLYKWLLSLRKREVKLVDNIGTAIAELLTYPAIIDNYNFHSYFPYYSLIADEFLQNNTNDLKIVLSEYNCMDEVRSALLYRLGYFPETLQRSLNHI